MWNNDTTIEKADDCNWCRQITDFFQYIYSRNPGCIIISNYTIFLLQFLFCKNTANMKECLAALTLLFCYSWNGWLQLELQINSISLERGMITSACFKETHCPWKYWVTSKGSWANHVTTQSYGYKCSFEITLHLK